MAWCSTQDSKSSSQRGGECSGSDREKGPTKEKLYNEVKQRGIRDRASMTKEQPRKAIEAKK